VELAQNLFQTRRGTIIAGAVAALLAGLLLLIYLSHYRSSVKASNQQASVLVARNLIPKGSSGDIIASTRQFQVAQLPRDEFKSGALTDPDALRGRVAVDDIFPNQQLTASEFVAAPPGTLVSKLAPDQRAIAVPLDAAHGLVGQIQPGDHVDVFVGLNVQGAGGTRSVLRLLMQDALVLRAPVGGSGGNIVLRADSTQAAALAFAADNGKLWLVLRPPSGAEPARPGLMTAYRLLLGVKPVR
jgi:Flp pilus assembly protein CpaB